MVPVTHALSHCTKLEELMWVLCVNIYIIYIFIYIYIYIYIFIIGNTQWTGAETGNESVKEKGGLIELTEYVAALQVWIFTAPELAWVLLSRCIFSSKFALKNICVLGCCHFAREICVWLNHSMFPLWSSKIPKLVHFRWYAMLLRNNSVTFSSSNFE